MRHGVAFVVSAGIASTGERRRWLQEGQNVRCRRSLVQRGHLGRERSVCVQLLENMQMPVEGGCFFGLRGRFQ